MLNFKAVGPYQDGRYLVGYDTPGCNLLTVSCDCSTAAQAIAEADRLNDEQLAREEALCEERRLCGLRGVYLQLDA